MMFSVIMAHAPMSFNNDINGYLAVTGADMVRYLRKREIQNFKPFLVNAPAQVYIFIE